MEYCRDVWYKKTRMVDLPDGKKSFRIYVLVSTQYANVTDTQPAAGQIPHDGKSRARL